MKIRIPLNSDILKSVSYSPLNAPEKIESSSEENSLPPLASLCSISFEPAEVADHQYSRYSHPCIKTKVEVPSSDLDRVRIWFGMPTESETSAPQASDTLLKRITNNLFSTLNLFEQTCSTQGIFIYPFKIILAWKMSDGSRIQASAEEEFYPSLQAPHLIIHEPNLTETTLSTITEINLTPQRAKITIPPLTPPAEKSEETEALEIIMTPQYPMRDGTETIEGVRSSYLTDDGMPARIWNYQRLEINTVRSNLHAISNYRIALSIPAASVKAGVEIDLTPATDDMDNWKPSSSTTKPGNSDNPDSTEHPDSPVNNTTEPQKATFATLPLDLGYPEDKKRVRAVTLRGIFSRDIADTELRLYASHHRQRWHLIAQSKGAHIRFLIATAYRWWRIEGNAIIPPGGQLDALTFEVKKS